MVVVRWSGHLTVRGEISWREQYGITPQMQQPRSKHPHEKISIQYYSAWTQLLRKKKKVMVVQLGVRL